MPLTEATPSASVCISIPVTLGLTGSIPHTAYKGQDDCAKIPCDCAGRARGAVAAPQQQAKRMGTVVAALPQVTG